jgi:hypothetical protein
MKVKLVMLVFSMLLLSGCQGSGAGCGGCVSGFWSTSCNIPNSGGASESQWTTIANPDDVVGTYHYSGYDGNTGGCPTCGDSSYFDTSYASTATCGGGGCGGYSVGPNW